MTRIIAVATILAGLLAGGCSEDQPASPVAAAPAAAGEEIRHSLEAAESYITSGDIDRARSILARLLEEAPGDARPYEVMARVELGQGLKLRKQGLVDAARVQFGQSYDWYEKAIARDPASGGLHQSGGEVAQLAGRTDAAMAHYRRARDLDPDNPKSRLCAAQLLLDDDPAQAEQLLNEVLELDPDQAHALASLALARQRLGDTDAASDAATQALNRAADDVSIRIAVARVHRVADRPREALELLLALPDTVRMQEAAAAEIALAWEAIDRPINAGEAWAECFRGNAHRTDAWRYALSAADAMGRADQQAAAASWLEQAIMLDAPRDQVDAIRSRIAETSTSN
ncbi:MAG: tetratricopeptide repeat protein [Phycisphaerales bacterium]|nr:tetratricopeptide repeat protein [Phycisphaerales bacterium]